MSTEKRAPRAILLIIIAALLIAVSLVPLVSTDAVLQYVTPAAGADIAALKKSWETASEGLDNYLSASAISQTAFAASFSTAGNSGTGTLRAVGTGWFAVYPQYLVSGRLMDEAELKTGARVIVLDEALAFKLFPQTEPLDSRVSVGGNEYRVIGVVRHSRRPGDVDEMGAYVPFAEAGDIGAAYVEIAGVPVPRSGAYQAFEDVGANWAPGGDFYDLGKEATRATIVLRLVFAVFAMAALLRALRWLTARAARAVARFREALLREYFVKLVWRLLGVIAIFILGYAAVVGAAAGVVWFTAQPLYVFTEWVPDVIVEWSSLTKRFWELTSGFAKPVTVITSELARIRFSAAILRWGVIAGLCAACLNWKRRQ